MIFFQFTKDLCFAEKWSVAIIIVNPGLGMNAEWWGSKTGFDVSNNVFWLFKTNFEEFAQEFRVNETKSYHQYVILVKA